MTALFVVHSGIVQDLICTSGKKYMWVEDVLKAVWERGRGRHDFD